MFEVSMLVSAIMVSWELRLRKSALAPQPVILLAARVATLLEVSMVLLLDPCECQARAGVLAAPREVLRRCFIGKGL